MPIVHSSAAFATSTPLTQHFLVRRDTLLTAGAILAGQDVQVMVF